MEERSKKVILNEKQLQKLVTDTFVQLNSDELIEQYDDRIVLNSKGDIYDIKTAAMRFEGYEVIKNSQMEYFQSLICKHLNLEPTNVIFNSGDSSEMVFTVRFAPGIQMHIVVCEFRQARKNMKDVSDGAIDGLVNKDYIGLYKKLADSWYYFRWVNEL